MQLFGSQPSRWISIIAFKSSVKPLIFLISIIHAVDGTVLFDTCLLGIGECEAEKPCALHAQWEIWRNEIDAMYSAMRLEELVADFANSKIKRL